MCALLPFRPCCRPGGRAAGFGQMMGEGAIGSIKLVENFGCPTGSARPSGHAVQAVDPLPISAGLTHNIHVAASVVNLATLVSFPA